MGFSRVLGGGGNKANGSKTVEMISQHPEAETLRGSRPGVHWTHKEEMGYQWGLNGPKLGPLQPIVCESFVGHAETRM